jgi:NTP pyrophosphatase (non-canonical NTP hydrolase)
MIRIEGDKWVIWTSQHGIDYINQVFKEEFENHLRKQNMKENINKLVKDIHTKNIEAGWWNDPSTGESLLDNPYVIATKLLLIISEISEATEGYRKDLMDDKLTHRSAVETELADAAIRLFDIAGALNIDLGGAIEEKRAFNAIRSDHKIENRVKKGGKKF